MANDLDTLTTALSTALRDTDHEVWTEPEKEDLVRSSIARLYPNVLKYVVMPIEVDFGHSFIEVGDATYPFVKITRIDLWDNSPLSPTARMVREIPGQAWELQTQAVGGSTMRVVINPAWTHLAGHYFAVHGYVQYDLTNNQVPDYLVPLVIARARAEAYRRMGADRAQFKNWLVANQVQNVSVNELLNLIAEADREAETLEFQYGSKHRKPVVARR